MDASLLTNYFFSLLTLSFLEIILGIDNLIFISITTTRLPQNQQQLARRFGLLFAMVTRLLLLAAVFLLVHFTTPLFFIASHAFSIRDLILVLGGIFLLYTGTGEIHSEVAQVEVETNIRRPSSLLTTIFRIGVLDIVFSLDSVITAVGMTQHYWVMATAIVIAIIIMLFLSEVISRFIQKNPTIKMLALSFIIMVGVVLIADGFGFHTPREYLYFAICFSLFVEVMNTLARSPKRKRRSVSHK